jgi:hypothetical protein
MDLWPLVGCANSVVTPTACLLACWILWFSRDGKTKADRELSSSYYGLSAANQ